MGKFADLFGVLGSTFTIGSRSLSAGVRRLAFRSGTFLGTIDWTLTANRSQTLPNKDGEIAVGIPLVGNVRLRNTASAGLSLGSEAASTGSNWLAEGFNAGFSNTTGSEWLAQGFRAGFSNNTGSFWMAQGFQSAFSNITGSFWMAQGYEAGYSNTTGGDWMAQGFRAGFSSTTGNDWIAQGTYTAFFNTTGSRWVAVGKGAAYSSTIGNNWTAIGADAANDMTTASNFVCIGFNAGRGITTGEGNTIIGANIVGLSPTLTNTAIIAAGNGVPLLTADSTGLRLGTTVSNSAVSFINGSFTSRISAATLTANRTIANPDKSGTSVLAELPASFNAVVPLQGDTSFPTQTVTGAIAFTLSSADKSACAKTTYRLTANGVNVPTFTGFTEIGDSLGYDNRSGILNVISFEWDGVTAWYRVHQAKFALPTLSAIAITFPSRQAVIGINTDGVNRYSSQSAEGQNFIDFMTSAQTIPAGKSGRITFRANQLMVVGFNTVSTLESYTNYEFMLFGSSGLAFTAIGGLNGSITTLSSGIAISTATADAGFTSYRMTRSSSGVVTAECSTNGGTTWQLMRTFAQTTTAQLWIGVNLSGNGAGRVIEFVSIEVEP